jgi:hypothetical protein
MNADINVDAVIKTAMQYFDNRIQVVNFVYGVLAHKGGMNVDELQEAIAEIVRGRMPPGFWD